MKKHRFRKIWEYCKKLPTGRTVPWRIARLTVILLAAIVFHFLFLHTHMEEELKKQIVRGIRDVCFLLGAVQAAFLLLKDQKILQNPGKKIKSAFRWLGSFVAGILVYGVDYIASLFSSRVRKRNGAGIITGYEDEQIRIKTAPVQKKRRRHHKSWNKMSPEERIRYLYEKRCAEAKKKEIKFACSDTPNELREKIRSGKIEKRTDRVLFPLYNEVRYCPDFMTTEEMVDSVLGKQRNLY